MINGSKIKETRKKLGLSQSDLAKGITTQGTISSLERNSTSPGSTILVKLLNRLGLELNDIMIDDVILENSQILNHADKLSMNYKHKEVLELLNKVKEPEAKEQLLHYQFLKTDAQMWVSKDYDDAIFGFNQLLLFSNGDFDIYPILATCELGVAYSEKDDITKSNFYFQQTMDLFNKFDENKNIFWSLLIIDNLSMYLSNNKKNKECLNLLNKGLSLAENNSRANFVDSFYYMYGEILDKMGKHQEATNKMINAWSFAHFLKNDLIEKNALSFLRGKEITLK